MLPQLVLVRNDPVMENSYSLFFVNTRMRMLVWNTTESLVHAVEFVYFGEAGVEDAEGTLGAVEATLRRINIVKKLGEAVILGQHVSLLLESIIIQPHLLVPLLLLIAASIAIFVIIISTVIFQIQLIIQSLGISALGLRTTLNLSLARILEPLKLLISAQSQAALVVWKASEEVCILSLKLQAF